MLGVLHKVTRLAHHTRLLAVILEERLLLRYWCKAIAVWLCTRCCSATLIILIQTWYFRAFPIETVATISSDCLSIHLLRINLLVSIFSDRNESITEMPLTSIWLTYGDIHDGGLIVHSESLVMLLEHPVISRYFTINNDLRYFCVYFFYCRLFLNLFLIGSISGGAWHFFAASCTSVWSAFFISRNGRLLLFLILKVVGNRWTRIVTLLDEYLLGAKLIERRLNEMI